ncbi:SLAM family member 5-like [Rhinoderma darwinii]|uniref:SLAM family member 5-like n=1 Tax=Rhinoderma darwinii TaxID=43563 RepID=UPI003F66608D
MSSVEEGEVVLRLDQVAITEVSWVTRPDNYNIARTHAGGKIFVRGAKYKGKLFGESDGSLRITNLTRDDQGLYKADQRPPENQQCRQFYLRVYKKIRADEVRIGHTASSNEGCSVNLTCTVNRSDVAVTWISSDRDGITRDNVVSVHNPDAKTIYTCTAWNPGTNRSKSVTPWSYCNEDRTQTRIQADYGRENFGRLILSGCILILASCLLTCHLRQKGK